MNEFITSYVITKHADDQLAVKKAADNHELEMARERRLEAEKQLELEERRSKLTEKQLELRRSYREEEEKQLELEKRKRKLKVMLRINLPCLQARSVTS